MSTHRRVLVTGARGMLGTDLCAVLKDAGHEVIPADIQEFDITDGPSTLTFAREHRPTVIINCAAYTAVDQAEAEREQAFRVNRDGTRNIAEAAADIGAPLLHISTDYVFDGAKPGPYVEDDPPNPASVYGASKLAGEEAVQETLAQHYIVRTAWLYGIHGKSFPRTMLNLRLKSKPLRVVDDQFGCPTYTRHLSSILAKIIERPAYGVYHAVNSGSCSWHELAAAVLRAAGLSPDIEPVPTSEFPRPAPRPANSIFDTTKLQQTFGLEPPPWQQGVLDFVARWKEEQRL